MSDGDHTSVLEWCKCAVCHALTVAEEPAPLSWQAVARPLPDALNRTGMGPGQTAWAKTGSARRK